MYLMRMIRKLAHSWVRTRQEGSLSDPSLKWTSPGIETALGGCDLRGGGSESYRSNPTSPRLSITLFPYSLWRKKQKWSRNSEAVSTSGHDGKQYIYSFCNSIIL